MNEFNLANDQKELHFRAGFLIAERAFGDEDFPVGRLRECATCHRQHGD